MTERISIDSNEIQSQGNSLIASISSDGRYIAFSSDASNLVAGDVNAASDAFVRDRQLGITKCASVNSSGVPGSGASLYPSISGDGRYVAFESSASDLVAVTANAHADIYIRDLQDSVTMRLSVDPAGIEGNNSSSGAVVSRSGRFVAFESFANNLVSGDSNACQDIFIRDLQSGLTERASVGFSGTQGNEGSYFASISVDGLYVAFRSLASNLVNGDTNSNYDIFVRERQPASPPSGYCFGDGSGTPCPCGNNSAIWRSSGCNSSLGLGGRLTASGIASLSSESLTLHGANMPDSSALYFQGTAQQNGGPGSAFGDGLRCVAGSVFRIGMKLNANNSSSYPQVGDVPISIAGDVTSAGIRYYQCWYRNAASFCTAATFNLTNGWQVSWTL